MPRKSLPLLFVDAFRDNLFRSRSHRRAPSRIRLWLEELLPWRGRPVIAYGSRGCKSA
jgi:hypothetical protein